MADDKCEGDWESRLIPQGGQKEPDGTITISRKRGRLVGEHADSDEFPVTCDGQTISFTRVGKNAKKQISYRGNISADGKKIENGKFDRADVKLSDDAEPAGARQSQQSAFADSGDWEATKPTLLKTEAQE
jgi:hypothetical protein